MELQTPIIILHRFQHDIVDREVLSANVCIDGVVSENYKDLYLQLKQYKLKSKLYTVTPLYIVHVTPFTNHLF